MSSKFFVVVWKFNGIVSSGIVEALTVEEARRAFEFFELPKCGEGAEIVDCFEWTDED